MVDRMNYDTIEKAGKLWTAELKPCRTCNRKFKALLNQTYCSPKCRNAGHYRRNSAKILANRRAQRAARREKTTT
jgi:hypothetical protein